MHKHLEERRNNPVVVIAVALAVGVLGVYLQHASHAATPTSAVEAESGTVTAPATVVADGTASGGNYLKFGAYTPPPPVNNNPRLGFYPAGTGTSQTATLDGLSQTYLGVAHSQLAETFIGPTFSSIANPTYVWTAYAGTTYRLVVSTPMLGTDSGASLATCATGAYDSYYTTLGNNLVSHGHADAIIRLGWEFNLSSSKWSASTDPTNWVTCFQHEATALRAASGQSFKIDWNTNNGKQAIAPDSVYPGDSYVDIIGVDAYDVDWSVYTNYTGDHALAWTHIVGTATSYNLQWQVNFAAAHHKLLSIPEWGVGNNAQSGHLGGDDPYYIQQMANWITTNKYYYADYFWQNNANGDYELTDFPNSATAFQTYFKPIAADPPSN